MEHEDAWNVLKCSFSGFVMQRDWNILTALDFRYTVNILNGPESQQPPALWYVTIGTWKRCFGGSCESTWNICRRTSRGEVASTSQAKHKVYNLWLIDDE